MIKQSSAFSKDNSKKDGFQSYCKECSSSSHKNYRKTNAEAIAAQKKEWRESNINSVTAQKKSYYVNNLDVYVAINARRRAAKMQATPLWSEELTSLVVREAYHLAALRKKATGFTWHVDHVIPLQGENVCGLHTWNNLAVIPAKENLSKSNKYVTE